MIIHESIVHGRCPLNGNWDYYSVEIKTDEFIDVADLEKILDSVRGLEATQETIAGRLFDKLPQSCYLRVAGRHSQNMETVIEL